MKTVHVNSYERKASEKKPDPFKAQIDARIAKRLAEAEAYRRMNTFQDEIGYAAGPRPVEIVMACARGLKRLALIGRV